MIRITKGPKPAVLVANEGEWTRTYVDHVQNGSSISEADKTRYRHPEIKTAVRTETVDKCAYCESKVTDVYPGDCEHILPKSHRPDLVVAWQNLTFSCSRCNTHKGDYYDPDEPLINPYEDEPTGLLRFAGPMALQELGSEVGERTLLRLKLSRGELTERRKERLEAVKTLIDRWNEMPAGARKELIAEQILEELADDKEYAAACRAFAELYAGIVPA